MHAHTRHKQEEEGDAQTDWVCAPCEDPAQREEGGAPGLLQKPGVELGVACAKHSVHEFQLLHDLR